MNSNKKDINIITDERLNWLIKNQSQLSEVPEEVDNKIISQFKEKNKSIKQRKSQKIYLQRNFILVAATIFIIIFTGFFISLFHNFNINRMLVCSIEKKEGEVLINNKLYNESLKNKFILKNQTIMTKEKASIDLKIGNNSTIKINEFSKIKIIQLKKGKADEFSRIYLSQGSISCIVTLPTVDSKFEIMTDNTIFTVKGTRFSLSISENKDVILNVEKGIVNAENFIKEDLKLGKIKKNYKDIYEQLINIIDYKIVVKENDSIILKNQSIREYNKILLELIDKINSHINTKNIDEYYMRDIIEEIKSIDNKKNDLYSYKTNENINTEDKFIIIKMPLKLGINFSEYDTVITSDGNRYFYISSDKNKTVYCIDIIDNILKWKFYDKKITNIGSPAIFYKNRIILAIPNMIYVLDEFGKKIFSKEISNGPSYWAYPKIINNYLYIPSFDTVYIYNGYNFEILNDKIITNGQIYISYYGGDIYFSVLNEKKVKKFNIKENRIVWESDVFFDRSFMPPVIVSQNIFIADIKGNIYKYDLNSNIKKQVKNDSGIISNMIYHDNYLYFVAIDGYLYKLKINDFNKIEKLYSVDNNPDKDKYLTKKMFLKDNSIYYCSDTGKLFIYDIKKSKGEFTNIPDNNENSALIGSPVELGKNIVVIDAKSNIYILKSR